MSEAFSFKGIKIIIITASASSMALNAIEFEANASAGITYSDNINENSDRNSSTVSTLSAGTVINIDRAKSDLLLKYNLYRVSYLNDRKEDKTFNELDLSANKNFHQKRVNVDVNASVTNIAESITDGTNASIINDNTIETRNVNTQLSYQNNPNEFVNMSTNLNASFSSNEDNIGNYQRLGGGLSLSNGQEFSNITWATNYSYSRTFYSNSLSDTSRYSLNQSLGYELINNLITSMRFNYDEVEQINTQTKNDFYSWGPSLRYLLKNDSYIELGYQFSPDDEDFWDGAVVLNPTNRTSIQFDFTRRFYGDAYLFSLNHKLKKLSNTIRYTEEVTDFSREFFVEDQFVNSFQLSKGFTFNSNLAIKNGSIDLFVSSLERTPLVFDELEELKINDISLNINYQLTKKHSINNSYNFRKNNFNYRTSEEEVLYYRQYRLSLNSQLSKRLNTEISYSYLNNSNYDENKISVNVNFTL